MHLERMLLQDRNDETKGSGKGLMPPLDNQNTQLRIAILMY
jgi:hypothetical protein